MAALPPGAVLIEEGAPLPEGATLLPNSAPPAGAVLEGEPSNAPGASAVDRFLDSTSVGRVLDAFGEGLKAGWGERPLGLTPEVEQEAREVGLFRDGDDGFFAPVRAFNEAIIRPAAAGLDAVMRGGSAVGFGIAGATGQVAEELGEDPAMAKRLTRDTLALAETFGIVAGTAPLVPKGRAAVRREMRKPETMDAVDAANPLPKAETAVDRAGNINLDRIQAPDDVKNVIREAAETGEGFLDARRGQIPLAETEKLADALGMTPKDLIKRKVGESFNAEEAVAARNLLVQSATDVRDLAAKAFGGSDDDILKFQEAVTRHMAIQEQVAGLTAEAGRALSSFRIAAKATKEAGELKDVLEQFGGRATAEEIAKKIGELDTPQKVSKFLADTRQGKFSDMVIEAWMNALLSGPQTHAVNVASNALVALWTTAETAVASGIGVMRGAARGDRVMFGETGARAYGFVQGAREGVVAGWKSYSTEIPFTGVGATKVEQPRQRAIPSARFNIGGREVEVGGKQVRIPGRLLMAADAFFQAIGYRQELNAMAYRRAAKEGLEGPAFASRVAELTNSPTAEMTRKARDNANYQTFTKELGPTGKAVQAFANSHPVVKFITPFVRTPVNIVKFAGERTPLSVFSAEVRNVLTGKDGPAKDQQIARLVTGSAVGAAVASLAAEGLVTGGGPTDSAQRAMLRATGWQPYSVKIGDMYYAYGRFEPLGMVMGLSADMADISHLATESEADELAAAMVASISKNLVSKTWLQGPSDLIQAVTDPDRYGERWLQRLAGTVVPTGVAQVQRVQDPILRDAQNVVEAIQSRIPGMTQDLLPRRDVWGEPIVLGGSAGPDIVSPIYMSRINNDPVNQELLRLQIYPSRVARRINGVELTAEQYDEYQLVAGRYTKFRLDHLIGQAEWGMIAQFAQTELVANAVSESRKRARSYMMMKHPNILTDAVDERVRQIEGN